MLRIDKIPALSHDFRIDLSPDRVDPIPHSSIPRWFVRERSWFAGTALERSIRRCHRRWMGVPNSARHRNGSDTRRSRRLHSDRLPPQQARSDEDEAMRPADSTAGSSLVRSHARRLLEDAAAGQASKRALRAKQSSESTTCPHSSTTSCGADHPWSASDSRECMASVIRLRAMEPSKSFDRFAGASFGHQATTGASGTNSGITNVSGW